MASVVTSCYKLMVKLGNHTQKHNLGFKRNMRSSTASSISFSSSTTIEVLHLLIKSAFLQQFQILE
jgi:hypothetical protein